jgi:hypothetical protein
MGMCDQGKEGLRMVWFQTETQDVQIPDVQLLVLTYRAKLSC